MDFKDGQWQTKALCLRFDGHYETVSNDGVSAKTLSISQKWIKMVRMWNCAVSMILSLYILHSLVGGVFHSYHSFDSVGLSFVFICLWQFGFDFTRFLCDSIVYRLRRINQSNCLSRLEWRVIACACRLVPRFFFGPLHCNATARNNHTQAHTVVVKRLVVGLVFGVETCLNAPFYT